MKKKERVTIKDIAKIANVTPQTVSRALRDASDISQATKARIFEIADSLNYLKNSTASALRGGSTHLIAVVYDELKNFYYSIMIDYIQSCLQERGFSILAFSHRYSFLTKETYLDVISHNVDGIISFLEPNEEIAGLIESYHIPVLLFGRRTELKNVDCIYTDDYTGGGLVAQKFIDNGCKKPAFITVPDNLACVRDRLAGFKIPFQERDFAPVRICNKESDFEKRVIDLFKDKNDMPDCIFCFNDMLAFEVLWIMEKNSLPSVSVIGYDNIQEQVHLPFRLTTIGTDIRVMVEHGVDLMLARVEGDDSPEFMKQEPVFLVEGTTA